MNRLSRALFFRTGLRGHVRHEIEREQLREQKAAAKLEQQLRQLRESSTATEEKLRQLTRRYDDLVQKYEASYFGRPEDGHDHGTKLLRSNRPIPDDHRGIYYPLREGASCELVKVVPARPNSMLVFASRIGLHGADIPADAQPSTLERYAYQFYVEAWSSSSNQRPDLDGG